MRRWNFEVLSTQIHIWSHVSVGGTQMEPAPTISNFSMRIQWIIIEEHVGEPLGPLWTNVNYDQLLLKWY